jgi:DNA transposition AAA+ family ATPase
MTNKIFPTILIILDICAAAGYIPDGDWRKIIYWLAAAILTFAVTW